MRTFATICSAIIGASILFSPIIAQAKTAKECRAEWQANKAANQAKKITESAYVKECTAGGTATQPAVAKPTKKTEPKATPASAAPKTQTKMAPAPAAPAAKSSSAATGANQYTTEAQAKARCGSGTVVWANLSSKIYHFSGHKDYGNTKNGVYMCERDATSDGMRAAKNEKHP
jgi:hypothetical protein